MKAYTLLPAILVIVTTLLPAATYAQYRYRDNEGNNNEFYVSEGIVTPEQINGWAGRGGFSGYVSMPSAISGALFITYRHFFTKRFALGVTAGLDDLSGDLSYGNPERSATGYDGISGHYNVRSYTVGLEALFAYFKKDLKKGKGSFMFYGYTGVGATSYQDKYTIFANAPYGSPVPIPSNPYDYHATYFNAQVTPAAIRFGGTVAGFVEIGFGYKGLLSGGLSVRF